MAGPMGGRAGWFVALCLVLCACGSPPQSTRLRVDDFDLVVAEMRESLARHLGARSPDSPPMRILAQPLRNESSDVLSKAERWMAVARVISSPPILALLRQKNCEFQMPLHQVEALRAAGYPVGQENAPTHEFTATLRSATRSGRSEAGGDTDLRKETYEFAYVVLNLATREIEWSDSVTFAREASGTVVN